MTSPISIKFESLQLRYFESFLSGLDIFYFFLLINTGLKTMTLTRKNTYNTYYFPLNNPFHNSLPLLSLQVLWIMKRTVGEVTMQGIPCRMIKISQLIREFKHQRNFL